ncbi:SRPBCC domain-containing protein [Nocardioides sp. CFH 31398]|uniref:SRPBCC domain-containing protein n=1 Tax=Nocardioides sp. CFH 31398 TaxID=2919579 RepID=UPI001F05BCAD|nr:SRPBCC domain-containing protein [Nocardioides sp. CFH 31398]MCH1868132.1 SRPBCC domain-containing protein [Nocardioides sp. CFH 31398]
MSRTATGRRERRGEDDWIVMERRFTAGADDVWAALTDPERMRRWIGTWTGDPADGHVRFLMLAEGDDVPAETMWIDECDPPRRLRLRSEVPGEDVVWRIEVDLLERDGVTTLRFAQDVPRAGLAESVGPGWEYYLDRLVAAETGGDVDAVDFDTYYPALSPAYADPGA